MSEILVDVKDLTIATNTGKILVDHVSFCLNRQQIVGVVGESGSGKSLTALALMGLLPTNLKCSGEIIWYGTNNPTNLLHSSDKDLCCMRGRDFSMVFQDPLSALNPSKKCGHQLEEALSVKTNVKKKEIKFKVLDIISDVRLPDPLRIYNSFPHQLSGGQRQRIMIAMALINKPELLIADEPTTALDVSIQKSIVGLMKDLQKEKSNSILFISHDLNLIGSIADQIIVMKGGKIVEQDSSSQIIQFPKHPYTKGLLACRPRFKTNTKRLPVLADFENEKKLNLEEKPKTEPKNFPLIDIENISLSYYRKKGMFFKTEIPILKNISFQVFRGETLGLVGESGSGKTSIGRCLMQLVNTSSGKIIYKGQNIQNLSKDQLLDFRKNAQFIFQDPFASLNPKLQIGDAIAEPMMVHGICDNKNSKIQVISLLNKVGLSENLYNRFPHELSGGQRQRVVIARALAMKPEFIVCDESVSALDVSVQAQVLNLLNDLKEEFNLSYLFISHDLAVVKYMSDRVIVLNKGNLVESETSENLFNHPQNNYTKELISSGF